MPRLPAGETSRLERRFGGGGNGHGRPQQAARAGHPAVASGVEHGYSPLRGRARCLIARNRPARPRPSGTGGAAMRPAVRRRSGTPAARTRTPSPRLVPGIIPGRVWNGRGNQDQLHIKSRGIAYNSRWRRDRGRRGGAHVAHPDQRERDHEALQERLTRLSEASLRINESLDFDQVLQGVLDAARSLTARPLRRDDAARRRRRRARLPRLGPLGGAGRAAPAHPGWCSRRSHPIRCAPQAGRGGSQPRGTSSPSPRRLPDAEPGPDTRGEGETGSGARPALCPRRRSRPLGLPPLSHLTADF